MCYSHRWNSFNFRFRAFCKTDQIMGDIIKAFQLTRTSMCIFKNLIDCIKETTKAFKITQI